MPEKEVVIIGAGVTGCSIAYHLAKQGVSSQVIERDSIAARASGKSWAIIPYPPGYLGWEGQFSEDWLISVSEGSLSPWLELFWLGYHRLPDIALDLQEKGGIDIEYGELSWTNLAFSESEEKTLKESLSFLKSRGYHEGGYWIKGDDLKAIYPDINPSVRGGKVSPLHQLEPYKYTLGLAQAAEKMGANFRQGEVVGFRHEGSKLTAVTLATGTEVEADVFVLAMGPWNSQGTSHLGKEIPNMVHLEECLRLEVPQRLPPYALTSDEKVVIIPKVDGTVILGISGVKHPRPDYDASLTEEVKTTLINGAVSMLPRLEEAKIIEHRGDLLAWSPPPNHFQPVLGRLTEWDNAYIAGRLPFGILMSPGVGQIMADLIMRDGKPPDRFRTMLDYLSPARLP